MHLPLGVGDQIPRSFIMRFCGSVAFSVSRALIKCCPSVFAMARDMLNVVVVRVRIGLLASSGLGVDTRCVNSKLPRLSTASSVVKVEG